MDPVTGAVVAGAGKAFDSVAKAGLFSRLVGPPADQLGQIWAEGLRRRNTEKLARKAERKAGASLDYPGTIPLRVAHQIIEAASFADEDVMQEYLAGLLAGSRTSDGKDDRAVFYVDILASMPAAQIRVHHAIYDALAANGPQLPLGDSNQLDQHQVHVPLDDVAAVVSAPEGVHEADAVSEVLAGLSRSGLVGRNRIYLRKDGNPRDRADFMVAVSGSGSGCMLALWAHARRHAAIFSLSDICPCDFDPPGPQFDNAHTGHLHL